MKWMKPEDFSSALKVAAAKKAQFNLKLNVVWYGKSGLVGGGDVGWDEQACLMLAVSNDSTMLLFIFINNSTLLIKQYYT